MCLEGTPSNINKYIIKNLCTKNGAFIRSVTIILLSHLTMIRIDACVCSYVCKHILAGYIEELMEETAKRCTVGEKRDSSNAPKTLEALASVYKRPDKAKAIQEYKSRFKT